MAYQWNDHWPIIYTKIHSSVHHANKIAFVFLYFIYNIFRPPIQKVRVNLHFKVNKGSFLILYFKQVKNDNNNFFS